MKDARKTVKSLLKLCSKKPEFFEKTFHWVPIDKWCKSTVKDMQKVVKKLEKDIKKTEKWKMELNKRHYDKEDTVELILKLTEVVDKPKVDLKKPQKIIKVEIAGNKAGLALLKADEELKGMLSKFESQIREKVGAEKIKISESDPGRKHNVTNKEKVKNKSFEIFFDKI